MQSFSNQLLFHLGMKISSLTALSQGKKRKVNKSEYSKLRVYNRILKAGPLSTSRGCKTKDDNQFALHPQQLSSTSHELRGLNTRLKEENQQLSKQLKKQTKIAKLLTQKYSCLYSYQDIEQRYLTQAQIQSLIQLKLTIEVFSLQQKLDQKAKVLRNICERKKKKYDEDISQLLNLCKYRFIMSIKNSNLSLEMIRSLLEADCIKHQERLKKLTKDWNQLKAKRKKYDNVLGDLEVQIKQLSSYCERKSKKTTKNQADCFQLDIGQTRNQEDLRNSISSLKEAVSQQRESMNKFLEAKMVEKLKILADLQEYGTLCKRFMQI